MTTPPPGPMPYPPPGQAPMPPSEAQMWAVGAHIGTLLVGFVAPLVAMLVVADRSPLARRHAVTSLNFQLSVLIYFIGGFVLVFVGMVLAVANPVAFLGTFLFFAVFVAAGVAVLVLVVIGAVRASQGQEFRYPVTIPFVR